MLLRRAQMLLAAAAVAFLAFVLTQSPTEAGSASAAAASADDAATWKKLLGECDIAASVKVLSAEIEKATKSSGTFARSFKKVEVNARLAALLGNVGSIRDEGELGKKAASLRAAGVKLAEAAKKRDYKSAQAAAKVIKSYPDGIAAATGGAPAKWEDVISLGAIMKGVSSIDSEAQAASREKDGKSFKKNAKDMQFKSQLLACLAVVARRDGDYKGKKDLENWCDMMCTDAAALAKTFQSGSQADVKNAYNAMQKSCTECHDVYRKEE